jgi:hypothetical protein
MKVQELLDVLNKLDPNKELYLDTSTNEYNDDEIIRRVVVKQVTEIRSISTCSLGDYIITII